MIRFDFVAINVVHLEKRVALERVFLLVLRFYLTIHCSLNSSDPFVGYTGMVPTTIRQRRSHPHPNPRITNNTKRFGESCCLLHQCGIRLVRLKLFFCLIPATGAPSSIPDQSTIQIFLIILLVTPIKCS